MQALATTTFMVEWADLIIGDDTCDGSGSSSGDFSAIYGFDAQTRLMNEQSGHQGNVNTVWGGNNADTMPILVNGNSYSIVMNSQPGDYATQYYQNASLTMGDGNTYSYSDYQTWVNANIGAGINYRLEIYVGQKMLPILHSLCPFWVHTAPMHLMMRLRALQQPMAEW